MIHPLPDLELRLDQRLGFAIKGLILPEERTARPVNIDVTVPAALLIEQADVAASGLAPDKCLFLDSAIGSATIFKCSSRRRLVIRNKALRERVPEGTLEIKTTEVSLKG